jgi:hypothetical protein
MPWPCRFITEQEHQQYKDRGESLPIGSMYYAVHMLEDADIARYYRMHDLSREYLRDWDGKRPPIIVILPNRMPFCVDSCYRDRTTPNPDRAGWTVTGEPPQITVSPSINVVGSYHGWLQNGILSEDVEGRTFQEE